MPPPEIITVTLHPTIDRVVGPGLPESGKLFAAGKGVNVARALSRLGVGCACFVLCPEEDQPFFALQCASMGPGPVEFVAVSTGGRVRRHVTRLAVPGCVGGTHGPEAGSPALVASDADLERLERVLQTRVSSASLLAFCGSLPAGVGGARFGELVDAAMAAGAAVLVDARDAAREEAMRRAVRVLKSNAEEARVRPLVNGEGLGCVAVTHGAEGMALTPAGGETIRVRAALPAASPLIDTTGCGDATTAGMLRSWAHAPGDYELMARWGVASGTASAASRGPGELDSGLARRLFHQI